MNKLKTLARLILGKWTMESTRAAILFNLDKRG